MMGNLKRRAIFVCVVLILATLTFSVTTFHPVIQEFQEIIEEDPVLFMLFNEMFEQIPCSPEFQTDPAGNPQIGSYMQMLNVM
ncbi:MAG: phophatidylserine decarboxylase associated domain-containing protein, partial [Mesotoga sp.]|uniref:phophatidylserine decarboxylase associated domain-containing protein n=1 Tax=Mesotoga sp. TaxID=2053577 RepID=UPI002639CD5C